VRRTGSDLCIYNFLCSWVVTLTDLRHQAFPFDPNPNWSHFYGSGAEIQEYIKKTVRKWNLDRDIQLNTQVTKAEWQEEQGVWKVSVIHDGVARDEYAEVLISAQGVLLYAALINHCCTKLILLTLVITSGLQFLVCTISRARSHTLRDGTTTTTTQISVSLSLATGHQESKLCRKWPNFQERMSQTLLEARRG
jgi:hypothetical protein